MLRTRSAALRAHSLLLSHAACAPAPHLRRFASDAAAEPLRSRRFVDWLRVVARAGNGGSGCVSFWHAAARKKRGPDGGGGGHGGDVVVRADATVRCLANVATTANAEAGGRGGAQGRAGRRGADMVVRVPVGTVVWHRLDDESGSGNTSDDDDDDDDDDDPIVVALRAKALVGRKPAPPPQPQLRASDVEGALERSGYGRNFRPALRLLADLSRDGESAVVARGGRGGRGNAALGHDSLGSQRDDSEPGAAGQVVPLLLELKAVADVGLVGAPNAGKSTLLATLTNARPEVAAYPFTTLRPQLGRVQATAPDGSSSHATLASAELLARTTLADIPGLVEGAHANRGLGHAFLRHVERCAALLLVVDLGADGRSGPRPAAQLRMLRDELVAYDAALAERPALVVGTKLDLPGAPRALAGLRRSAAAAGLPPPLGVSAESGEGVEALRAALLALAGLARAQRPV